MCFTFSLIDDEPFFVGLTKKIILNRVLFGALYIHIELICVVVVNVDVVII